MHISHTIEINYNMPFKILLKLNIQKEPLLGSFVGKKI